MKLAFLGYAFSYLPPFLYFHRPTLFTYTLLRPKPYFDFFGETLRRQNCTSGPNSNLDKCRSTEVQIERSNYRKGRRYENGRSTEKVELMRVPFLCQIVVKIQRRSRKCSSQKISDLPN